RARLGYHQGLRARVEDTVSALQLRPVDGEVGLMDQLVRVCGIPRERGDADRDGCVDRLARSLDVDRRGGDCAPDAFCDLEGLLGVPARDGTRRWLTAGTGRGFVMGQAPPAGLGEGLE